MVDKPYVELKDKYGNSFVFGNCGDVIFPAFPPIRDFRQHRKDIANMELNPTDVIIAGYPKTGTHWSFEIISMLMQGKPEYVDDSGHKAFIDFSPVSSRGPLPPPDKPRCLFTHLRFDQLPKQVFQKKVKVVYLERNPKDTWVSYYHHAKNHAPTKCYEGTWDQFFELMATFGFWYGDWFDYVLDWERALATQIQVPVLTMTFEKLKQDPLKQIQRLDDFLGYKRGPELCQKIAEACSFNNLKTAKENMARPEVACKDFKDGAPPTLFRIGEVGDWKNWFNVTQTDQFDALYARRMAGSSLKYTYEL